VAWLASPRSSGVRGAPAASRSGGGRECERERGRRSGGVDDDECEGGVSVLIRYEEAGDADAGRQVRERVSETAREHEHDHGSDETERPGRPTSRAERAGRPLASAAATATVSGRWRLK
jgi:hypothetical protein